MDAIKIFIVVFLYVLLTGCGGRDRQPPVNPYEKYEPLGVEEPKKDTTVQPTTAAPVSMTRQDNTKVEHVSLLFEIPTVKSFKGYYNSSMEYFNEPSTIDVGADGVLVEKTDTRTGQKVMFGTEWEDREFTTQAYVADGEIEYKITRSLVNTQPFIMVLDKNKKVISIQYQNILFTDRKHGAGIKPGLCTHYLTVGELRSPDGWANTVASKYNITAKKLKSLNRDRFGDFSGLHENVKLYVPCK